MIKTLFLSGARVDEFVHIRVEHLHLDGHLEAHRLHIRSGLRFIEGFDAVRDDRIAVDRANTQWLRASALALDGNRAGALQTWDRAVGAMEMVVKQHPADQRLRDEFLVLLHATVLLWVSSMGDLPLE